MQRFELTQFEIVMLCVGAVLFVGSAVTVGNVVVNTIGAMLMLAATVLYLVRYLQNRTARGGRAQ